MFLQSHIKVQNYIAPFLVVSLSSNSCKALVMTFSYWNASTWALILSCLRNNIFECMSNIQDSFLSFRASVVGLLKSLINGCCIGQIFPIGSVCQRRWLASELAADHELTCKDCGGPRSDSLCHVISPTFETKAIGIFPCRLPPCRCPLCHCRSRILVWGGCDWLLLPLLPVMQSLWQSTS